MKRIIIVLCFLMSLNAYAQQVKPEEIPWLVVRQKSPEWYVKQTAAWEKVVAREPNNENAWFNLSMAMRYSSKFGEDNYAKRQALYQRMSKAIPDTYTYHFCASDNDNDSISAFHIERAYQLMPEDHTFGEEYGIFIAYFWKTGQEENLKDVARRYYLEQSVPSCLLRYNYNELQCLPENAIYFGSGDAVLLPKLALQYGMHVHQDKMVICVSFLGIDDYYERVCKQLNIKPEKIDKNIYSEKGTWKNYIPDRVKYIIKTSGRPSYICPSSQFDGSGLDCLKENLYNEGLVLRYSEKPYDNFARVRENLERNIRLDYLLEPDFIIEPQWQSANKLACNYIIMLSPLIQKYKDWGNLERSVWLQNLLTDALKNSKMPAELKANCHQYLNQYIAE